MRRNHILGPQAAIEMREQGSAPRWLPLQGLAQSIGMETAELQQHILGDEDLWVDSLGQVVYVDSLYVDGDGEADDVIKRGDTTIPLDQAFLLNSKPDSNYTIYLDFDGHHSFDNGWGHDIVFPAYDTNNDPNNFSNSELRATIDHWRYMAEDFAIFDVNVTTQEPPLDRLMYSGSSDSTWGVRDVHTQATDGFGNGIGGIAGLNTFRSNLDRPVFSFNKGTNNGSMTGSHEVGHAMGLVHDGLNGSTYHPGASQGSYTWGPIMGAPFGAEIVHWSAGDYAGSTANQNDISVINSGSNGTRLLPDDHGGLGVNATSLDELCTTPNQIQLSALITGRLDRDAFTFVSTGGVMTATVGPNASNGIVGNADCSLELFDANGVSLVKSNRAQDRSAGISRIIGPGVYTLVVDGDIQYGLYSDYGSRGQYDLDVTYPGRLNDFNDLGNSLPGTSGAPLLSPSGYGCEGETIDLALSSARPSSPAFLAYGVNRGDVPLFGGILVPNTAMGGGIISAPTDVSGDSILSRAFPAGVGSGTSFYFQYWIIDNAGPQGWAASNAVVLTAR